MIRYQPFAGGAGRELLHCDKRLGFGFGVSHDKRIILYTRVDQDGSDLWLIDHY